MFLIHEGQFSPQWPFPFQARSNPSLFSCVLSRGGSGAMAGAAGAAQPASLAAIPATCLPWNFAPSSSTALGWRDPWLPAMVLAP